MFKILFALWMLGCVSGFPGFQQSDYKIIYERAEVIDYNREYFSNAIIKNSKYNRTQVASNGTYTLLKDISSHLKIEIQAHKFMSNEYRGFPIRFSYSFCEGLLRDDFGMQSAFECGNLTIAEMCPVARKGVYFVCNFKPNEEKFAPNIPEGSYMLDIKWFHGLTEVLFVHGYGTVKNKFLW